MIHVQRRSKRGSIDVHIALSAEMVGQNLCKNALVALKTRVLDIPSLLQCIRREYNSNESAKALCMYVAVFAAYRLNMAV